MIILPTTEELEQLQTIGQDIGLSLYIPYVAPSSSDNPNRIQLKNALKEAGYLLRARKLHPSEIDKILQPARKLLDSDEFRSVGAHSLALFMRRNFFAKYHLPSEDMKPIIKVGKIFDTDSLAEIMRDNQAYYILILNHNNVGLLRGDRYHIERLDNDRLPTNMVQTLGIDEYPKEQQTHSVAATSIGKGSEQAHGQYNKKQVDKDLLTEFFRRIDRQLHKIIKDIQTPLIISGADSVLSLYRKVSTYPSLLVEEIKGNMEHEPLESMRARASKLMTVTPLTE